MRRQEIYNQTIKTNNKVNINKEMNRITTVLKTRIKKSKILLNLKNKYLK